MFGYRRFIIILFVDFMYISVMNNYVIIIYRRSCAPESWKHCINTIGLGSVPQISVALLSDRHTISVRHSYNIVHMTHSFPIPDIIRGGSRILEMGEAWAWAGLLERGVN